MFTDVRHAVFFASRDGRLRKLQRLLEEQPEEAVKTAVLSKTNGATPLVIAAKNGHLETVEFLIRRLEADVEQTGNVQFDGETIESAPPLWCAAAAGHFDVVKCLIRYNARVNSTTKTKSTPLRAACYDGHLHIVKYLVDRGADVEIANRHGHTCLMIACYKGHYEIANYLIQKGANVNRKSVKGNTALHDCAESGSLEIMQLLLDNSAKMDKDSYGVTPLIAAALTGHAAIVELIIRSAVCQPEERVDALDLLGATYVDKKRDMMAALEYWRRAFRDSQEQQLSPSKRNEKALIAYAGAKYIEVERQLEELFSDPDDMRMQALFVRERVLGPSHPDTSYYIRYRGAVYADTGDYDKCISLWMYALNMQQSVLDTFNPMIQSSLLSFAELFSFMMTKSPDKVKFKDLLQVFKRALTQLQAAAIASTGSNADRGHFNRTLVVVLHFVGLMCRLQPFLSDNEMFSFKKGVYELVRPKPRGVNGRTPLHLACLRDLSPCPSQRFPLCEFPMPEMVRILLEVGSPVNDCDRDQNTALHLAAICQPVCPEVVQALLEHGAHLDSRNSKGETALQLLTFAAPAIVSSCVSVPKIMSLQCLAAQVIARLEIPVSDILTEDLDKFVRMH